MLFIGECRLLGTLLSVACGMHRYVFYRCVSVAWEIAVGSLWNVSVCFLWGRVSVAWAVISAAVPTASVAYILASAA